MAHITVPDLRALREKTGLSQSEVAKELGTYPSLVCAVENSLQPGGRVWQIASLLKGHLRARRPVL